MRVRRRYRRRLPVRSRSFCGRALWSPADSLLSLRLVFMDLWQWLYDLSVVAAVRDSQWAFPILESIHIYSMIFLVALFGTFDMKLMGLTVGGQKGVSISAFSR